MSIAWLKKGFLGGLILAAAFAITHPCYAASQSVTFTVSCVVPTNIEIAPSSSLSKPSENSSQTVQDQSFVTPQRTELGLNSENSLVNVKTNLGDNFRLNEEILKTAQGSTKLFSVTAL